MNAEKHLLPAEDLKSLYNAAGLEYDPLTDVLDLTAYIRWQLDCSGRFWYGIEAVPVTQDSCTVDVRIFGLVVNGDYREFTHFLVSDLKQMQNDLGFQIERDSHFRPCRVRQLPNAHLPRWAMTH